jgi:hypothetical protein
VDIARSRQHFAFLIHSGYCSWPFLRCNPTETPSRPSQSLLRAMIYAAMHLFNLQLTMVWL